MKLDPEIREFAPVLLKWLEKWGNGEVETLALGHFGICHNLREKIRDEISTWRSPSVIIWAIGEAAESWSEYSGDETFPVPQTDPEASKLVGNHLWQGEQLELRKSLCRHVLKVLNEALEQDNG